MTPLAPRDDDEWTPERVRALEARWKSDVDAKLNALVAFMQGAVERERTIAGTVEKLEKSVGELTDILATGKGGLAFLFLSAKVMGAFAVIGAGIYAVKAWIMRGGV